MRDLDYYNGLLVDLSGDMMQRLRTIKAILDERGRQEEQARKYAATERHTLFLHGRENARAAWEEACDSLQEAGFLVLPDGPLPIESDGGLAPQYERMLRQCDGLLLLATKEGTTIDADIIVIGRNYRRQAVAERSFLPCAVLDMAGPPLRTQRRLRNVGNLGLGWIDGTRKGWPEQVKQWLGAASLEALAPGADPARKEALAAARALRDPQARLNALLRLNKQMPDAESFLLRTEALAALLQLAEQLSEKERFSIIELGFDAANSIKNPRARIRALRELGGNLREVERSRIFEEAKEATAAIADPRDRIGEFLELLEYLSEEERWPQIEGAADIARQIADSWARVTVLFDLLRRLPEGKRSAVFMEALRAAQAVQDRQARRRALLELRDYVIEKDQLGLIQKEIAAEAPTRYRLAMGPAIERLRVGERVTVKVFLEAPVRARKRSKCPIQTEWLRFISS